MLSIRTVGLAALVCAVPGLPACAHQEVDVDAAQQLSDYRLGCLSARRPEYSPEHVDCVVARYQERQRAIERLRSAMAPPPPPPPPMVNGVHGLLPIEDPVRQPWLI